MLIDWFTVAAQVVNFLILVWLLRRFLYRPVLAAIDARERQIAAQLADAANTAARAQQEREEFQHRNAALEQERSGLLRKATEEAATERQRLFEAARQETQAMRSKLGAALASDREDLARRLSSQTQAEVFALSRKALADLANLPIEDRMVEVFLERLRALPEEQRSLLAAPTGPAPPAAIVRSAFELSLARRTTIKAALGECLGTGLAIRFELTPELICGIDVTVNGVKLAWSINDHLLSMADRLGKLLAPAQAVPEAPSLETARHG